MERLNRVFINTYLDAPILEGNMLKCLNHYAILLAGETVKHPSKTATYLARNCGIDWNVECYSPNDLPVIVRTLERVNTGTGTSEAWRVAHAVWNMARNGFSKVNPRVQFPSISEELPTASRELYVQAELFVRFVDRLASARAVGSHGLVTESYSDLTLAGDQYSCALLYHVDKAAFCLPYEAVLMFKDMLLARANVFLSVHLAYQNDACLLEAVKSVIFWEEECLYRYGNPGYEILKQIEPLVKAYVIHVADPLLGNHEVDVYSRISGTVVEKERRLGARSEFQAHALQRILEKTPRLDHLVELFGLQRLAGHPLIDPRVGGMSAAEEASRPAKTTYNAARRLRSNWCRLYLEGYVRRSGQWPPLAFSSEGRSTQLFQLYRTRDRDLQRNSYQLEEWDHVRFRKHQEFDYYTNFTDLMDDKSISLYRDEFRATWDRSVKPRSQRRLLLEMLTREEISIRQIIELVEARRVPLHWFIVSLYPKEREFKLAARMFSMMPFEMRAFFAALEANIADHVFPNMPQQTMTLSRTEIVSRFFHLSRPLSAEGRHRLYIEVDLSRWNLRWRDLVIRLIGNDLDDIFGTNGRYTWVHEFFRNCMISVRVADYEPVGLHDSSCDAPHPLAHPGEPPASDLLWYGHEGGFEGISQKHWTIATYSMIDLGMASYELEYSLVGQGDNQVILSTVTTPPDVDTTTHLRALASDIKRSIAESCAEVGQEAKEEECLESTNVVTYSKNFYLEGAEFFLTLKATSRIFPRGASDFPTVSNGVAAITSSCIAAAEQMKQPLLGFFLSLFHTARYLIRVRVKPTVEGAYLVRSTRDMLIENRLTLALVLPGSMGGIPIAPLCSFVYKGGGDPGSKDYLSMKILYLGGLRALGRVNEALLSATWRPAEVNPEQLLEDPYAVPIRRATTAENRVLDMSLRSMIKITKNKAIRDLIEQSVADYDDELRRSLMEVTPFNPALLSDVRSFSLVGAREMTLRMFTVTRTVQSLAHRSEDDPGGSILLASAAEVREFLTKVSTLPATSRPFEKVYDSMEALRDMWSSPTRPIKVVGITSYIPLDWGVLVDDEVTDAQGIILSYSPSPDPWHTRGREDPYFGTDTAERRTKHGYKILSSSAAEKAYARLATIATQPGVNQSFTSLVCTVAKTRSAIPLEKLLPFLSRAVGGSIAHRYQSTLGNRGASILGCGTIASHIAINSDYAGILSASLLDYPVMFQEAFCAAISLLNLVARQDPTVAHYVRLRTPDTLRALPEEPVVARYAPSICPVLDRNPIAYCTDLLLVRITRPTESVLSSPLSACDMTTITPARLAYQAAYRQLLNRHTAHLIADLGYGAVKLPLDLLEFRGLGLANVAAGVATAIARFSIDAMFSRSHKDLRWSPMPVITSLASSFSVHLINAARHPLFADDPYAQEFMSSTGMMYNRRRELDTLIGLITSSVLSNIDRLTSLHADLTELVFDDDAEDTPLLRAESILKRIALRAVLRGEITASDGYMIARRNLAGAVRAEDTVGGKMLGVYHLACVLAEWAANEEKPSLAEEAGHLAKGHWIKRVYRSQLQVLRMLRGRSLTLSSLSSPMIEFSPPAWLHIKIDDAHPITTVADDDPYLMSLSDGYHAFSLLRRYIRKYGRHAPSVYSYWPIAQLVARQNVLILGSGNGGALNVCTLAGAVSIATHDLASDIGLEEIARPTRRVRSSFVYRSRASSGEAGGDLRADSTWKLLASDLLGYRVIVLDVPLPWSDLQHIFGRLSVSAPGSLLVTRWLASPRRLPTLLATVSQVPGYQGTINVFSHAGYTEFLTVHRIEWHGAWHPQSGVVSGYDPSVPDYSGIKATGGGWRWNMLTYRGVSPDDMVRLMALSEQAMGKGKHSFTYTQWTSALRSFLGCQLDSDLTWIDSVRTMVLSDITTVRCGSSDLEVAVSPSLRRWLAVEYPRTRM